MEKKQSMVHIVSVLVENHFGVLARISGLFSARGFNIDSLAVGETEDSTVSRITIAVHGDERVLEQIMKQLDKLVDVIKVIDLSQDERIERELILVKVSSSVANRADVMQIANTFRAKIVDINPHSLTVEVTGNKGKVDALIELLRPFGICEVVRTGTIALSRKRELKASSPNQGSQSQALEATEVLPKKGKASAKKKKTKVG